MSAIRRLCLFVAAATCLLAGLAATRIRAEEPPFDFLVPPESVRELPRIDLHDPDTVERLKSLAPYFAAADPDTSGFYPVAIPFTYVNAADPNSARHEADAFAFLLSNDLAWAPAARPYRDYLELTARQAPQMESLARKTDLDTVRQLVKRFRGTHAIGGRLRRSDDGLSGTLTIYDPQGKEAFSRTYRDPRPFWELLGDMGGDALTFFGHKPNDLLQSRLSLERCKNDASIVDLGRMAFEKSTSEQRIALCESILKRDPDFADVRGWYGRARYFPFQQREYDKQRWQAHNSYLVISDLPEIWPHIYTPDLEKHYDPWIPRAQKLLGGALHPAFVNITVKFDRHHPNLQMLEHAGTFSAAYPNHIELMEVLQHNTGYRGLLNDPAMAAGMALALLTNPYYDTPRRLDKRSDMVRDLGYNLCSLGYHDEGLAIVREALLAKFRKGCCFQCRAQLTRGLVFYSWKAGRFNDVVDYVLLYLDLFHKDLPLIDEYVTKAAVAGVLCGRSEVTEYLCDRFGASLKKSGGEPIVEAFRRLARREAVNLKRLRRVTKPWRNHWLWETFHLLHAIKVVIEKDKGRIGVVDEMIGFSPTSRVAWYAFHESQRRMPRPRGTSLYQALEWHYGDDPWVRRAVREHDRAAIKHEPPTFESLIKLFEEYDTARWFPPKRPKRKWKTDPDKLVGRIPAGGVDTAIRWLLDKNQLDKAMILARKYHHWSVVASRRDHQYRLNLLIHIVDRKLRARKKGR